MPNFLLIHLKRFSFTTAVSRSGRRLKETSQKREERISFPCGLDHMDLSKLVGSTRMDEPAPLYDVVSVINHEGTMSDGHYTAFARKAAGEAGKGAGWP